MNGVDDNIGGSGYSLDDLSEYLDRGRTPPIAAIDTNPECQALLASLERFSALSRQLVEEEAQEELPEGWLDRILHEVTREVRAGRDLPIEGGDDHTTLFVTEGALREVARDAGDAVPGVLVGKVRLEGVAGGPVTVRVWMSVRFGVPVRAAVDDVRVTVAAAVENLTTLPVSGVDVTVVDVHDAEGLEGQ